MLGYVYIYSIILDMASSPSTNSSNNQDNTLNQSSKNFDESKEILSASPSNVEQAIKIQSVTTINRRRIGI